MGLKLHPHVKVGFTAKNPFSVWNCKLKTEIKGEKQKNSFISFILKKFHIYNIFVKFQKVL